MNLTIEILGLIAAALTIIGWALEYFFSNFEKTPTYHKVNKAMREAVHGEWAGEFQQELNGERISVPISLIVKVSKKGRIKGQILFSHKNVNYNINVRGGFYLLYFLKLEYENSDQGTRQFGSFVLELTPAKELDGCFVGYGNVNRRVISGPVKFSEHTKAGTTK